MDSSPSNRRKKQSNHPFRLPTDLTSDPLGTLTYVAGYTSNNIAVFDVNGNLRTRFSGGVMPLSGPWGVLAMSDGNLFVSEFRGQRITLLNPNGRRLLTLEAPQKREHPRASVYDKYGRWIFICK